MSYFLICCLFFALGCAQPSADLSPSKAEWQLICGRDEGEVSQRLPIYRGKIFSGWTRQDPPSDQSNADTMKSLCEFTLGTEGELLRVTIHNFPSHSMQERIPSSAQIARWKRQFDHLALTDVVVTPLARGGFKGLYFEGKGIMQATPMTVIGWAMQMAPEQYQNLDEHSAKDRQKRSDYTIKMQGHPDLVDKYRAELLAFAASFELIEEIP